MNILQELFTEIFAQGTDEKPIKLVFSNKRHKSLEYSKVTVRPILLSDEISYQAEYTYKKRLSTGISARKMLQHSAFN